MYAYQILDGEQDLYDFDMVIDLSVGGLSVLETFDLFRFSL